MINNNDNITNDNITNDNTITNIFIGLFSVAMFAVIVRFCVFTYFKWFKGKNRLCNRLCRDY